MAESVRCLGCGFEIPPGKRMCPTCLAPQPQNRRGYIVASACILALFVAAWVAMKMFGN